MDPIEPIRLDMNLFNMAMMQRQHQAGLEETQRHHGILEQQGAIHNDALSQKVQADALTNVMNNPDIDPIARQRAASTLYGFASKNQGPQLDPGDYLKYEPLWRNFLGENAKNPKSQATVEAMQQLSQVSPFSKDRIKEAQERQQQANIGQGMSELPTLAGKEQFSPQIGAAIQSSPQLLKSAGEAYIDPVNAARAKQIDDQTQDLKTRETLALGDFKAYNTAVTPVFDIPTEEAHIANLAKQPKLGGPLTSDQSKRSQTDKSARMYGALTSEQREQAKATIPQVMDTLNQQATDLQQQLHNAKHDLEGKSGNPDTIKSQLDATRLAVGIKGKELAYLESPTTANRLAVKNAYGDYQKLLDQKKSEVLRLRQASSNTAQSALSQMKYEDTLAYRAQLIPAVAEYRAGAMTPERAGQIGLKHGVMPQEVEKLANQPLTTVNVNAEKSYGTAFADKVAAADVSLQDSAQKAPDLAQRAIRIQDMIQSGAAITGTGAEFRLQFAKAMKLAGLSDSDSPEITESLATDLASNTLDSIKASGLGGGTGFSNADRDFLEKAKGGKIELQSGTLMRLSTLAHRAAENTAKRYNARIKQIPDSALQGTGVTRDEVHVPPLKTTATPSQKPASTAPKVGQMDNGYIFKGGDPSKKENWEKK